MEEPYLTKQNISSKVDKWLNSLNLPTSRKDRFLFNPKKSALLVIDMQKFFLNEESHAFIPTSKIIIQKVNFLINSYRKMNLPIIFTFHAYEPNEDPGIMEKWWNDVLRITHPMSEIDTSVNWNEDDITIRKNRYSAFIDTNLNEILRSKNVEQVLISGVLTHLCCETTAREAFMKDYEVYFIVDATATYNELLHVSSLRTLSDGFVIPVKTADILKEMNNNV